MVILEFRVQFIIGSVGQLPEHELEIDAHIGVVMQRHHCALLNEEEHEAVVIVATDCDFIQARVEMIVVSSATGALDTQLLDLDRIHLLNNFLTKRVFQAVVQKVDIVTLFAGFDAHLPHGFYKTFHNPDFVGIWCE